MVITGCSRCNCILLQPHWGEEKIAQNGQTEPEGVRHSGLPKTKGFWEKEKQRNERAVNFNFSACNKSELQ